MWALVLSYEPYRRSWTEQADAHLDGSYWCIPLCSLDSPSGGLPSLIASLLNALKISTPLGDVPE